MEPTAVGFDDQARVAPEEVGLVKRTSTEIDEHIDLGTRQVSLRWHSARNTSLQLAARLVVVIGSMLIDHASGAGRPRDAPGCA